VHFKGVLARFLEGLPRYLEAEKKAAAANLLERLWKFFAALGKAAAEDGAHLAAVATNILFVYDT
jgi:hypothetical protein